jgi:acyl-CoA dehydrogenase
MRFVLHELAGLADVLQLPGYEDASAELVDAILEEAGKFASGVLAPLNASGDREGVKLEDGQVTTPTGFPEAYKQFVEGGWNGLDADPAFGGQGLPNLVATPATEMFNAANLSFTLCPMLTESAIAALTLRGSDAQQATYLHKLVSGEWTGTMNLTEPQAGSDLAQVRTKAQPDGDHYRLTGQKIYITYGEHDWADNIIHLVLARTPDAPEGVKGISLFVVPKYVVGEDGEPGERNAVHCSGLEEKLGIHASPTAVMSYEDAAGYLVGEENRGLEYMFIMMNLARFGVGIEGLAISERAYQQAVDYARQRIQGKVIGERGGPNAAIIRHPDVRRMLMDMRAQVEAMRAVAYVVAGAMDAARHHPDQGQRERSQAFADLMIPVIKGWCTESSVAIASTGIQVHGGMGFIEETGAAQYLRDARITPIYEGTTGIQANDLIGRKITRDGGQAVNTLIETMRVLDKDLAEAEANEALREIRQQLGAGVEALSDAVAWLLETYQDNPRAAFAGSVPMLELMAIVTGGWQMARAALAAQRHLDSGDGDTNFYRAKLATARFFADHHLSRAPALSTAITRGAESTLALDEAAF